MFKIASKKKKGKWVLATKDIINENFRNDFHIELNSNREIIVEGCLGVFEYKNDFLKLRIKNGYITICGKNFDIVSFDSQIMTIKGSISSIEISY